jgi:5-oxoprolinase (ATP-hydrolysing) subunit A
MSDIFIDINADLGESPEALANVSDLELMRYITSANVACGGHAGDVTTMKQTLLAARGLNVLVGAHPSYPDPTNFGRIQMALSPEELERTVSVQITSLVEIAKELGMRVVHVKPHGALYHATRDRETALAVGRAVVKIDPTLIMVGQAGSQSLTFWRDMGLRCAAEAFADRAYEAEGTLRNRKLPGALLDTPERAAHQALDIALWQRVTTTGGCELPITANTICIHSDTPGAAAIAREVRHQLTAAGVHIRPLSA